MHRALRRALATTLLLLVTAVPLAACDSEAPPSTPDRADLKAKGCC